MRSMHRWTATIVAIFLACVAVTGVILQAQKLTGADPDDPDNAQVSASLTTSTPQSVYTGMINRALAVARAKAPAVAIVSLTVQSGPQPRVSIRLNGDPQRQITVDAGGNMLADEPFEAEDLMHRIHDGSILGDSGVVMGVLWGSGLALLALTGVLLYLDMYRRRVALHRKRNVFW